VSTFFNVPHVSTAASFKGINILAYLRFQAKLGLSLSGILRLLQLNLFDRRLLSDLFKPPDKPQIIVSPQLSLWN